MGTPVAVLTVLCSRCLLARLCWWIPLSVLQCWSPVLQWLCWRIHPPVQTTGAVGLLVLKVSSGRCVRMAVANLSITIPVLLRTHRLGQVLLEHQ